MESKQNYGYRCVNPFRKTTPSHCGSSSKKTTLITLIYIYYKIKKPFLILPGGHHKSREKYRQSESLADFGGSHNLERGRLRREPINQPSININHMFDPP
jgi:hypothetical protein